MQGETGTVGSRTLYHMAESGERTCNMWRWKSLSGHTGRCRRVTEYLWWEIHRNVSPEEAPSVNHQPWEGTKRHLCCDAAPQEVSSRNQLLAWRVPYVVPLKITQSWQLSVRTSQKRCSTGLMQPPMAWVGTTCLKDWPQLGLVPHALCSYTQPLWSHTALLWIPTVWPWVPAVLITCSGPLSPQLLRCVWQWLCGLNST